mmetsp:Transcript_49535/g.152880  ORF Transcript_49535/g.152880 Transcript_49535/m.152880 type:complete len:299 (-) Transcript_49535:37-933(-)
MRRHALLDGHERVTEAVGEDHAALIPRLERLEHAVAVARARDVAVVQAALAQRVHRERHRLERALVHVESGLRGVVSVHAVEVDAGVEGSELAEQPNHDVPPNLPMLRCLRVHDLERLDLGAFCEERLERCQQRTAGLVRGVNLQVNVAVGDDAAVPHHSQEGPVGRPVRSVDLRHDVDAEVVHPPHLLLQRRHGERRRFEALRAADGGLVAVVARCRGRFGGRSCERARRRRGAFRGTCRQHSRIRVHRHDDRAGATHGDPADVGVDVPVVPRKPEEEREGDDDEHKEPRLPPHHHG